MVLAIKATADGIDGGTLDAVTLVLLVGFVVSLVALSALLARRSEDAAEEPAPEHPAEEVSPPSVPRPRTEPRPNHADPSLPAWLAGVALPRADGALSEATALIEQLLEARRMGNLEAGIALYSPAFRVRMASALGVADEGLERVLADATIEGSAPSLRSIELVTATGDALTVRVGYADRSAEIYQLIRLEKRWAIDSIDRA